ncbi:MAG: CpsD/CapB family tyrosine-protein kinase [Chloroflexi bacterium]|nr:CpsD/CapB family tyrosine-protein kinase [Chloroflexota bacterium]
MVCLSHQELAIQGGKQLVDEPLPRLNLVTVTNPRSPVSEAFRTLRTNIQFSSLDRPLKTILVTSTDPGEGKSTVLANLAVTMAQSGLRTVVADCDLRRPSQHQLFGLSNINGLTSMMVGNAPMERASFQDTAVPNLRLLASGPLPPNPSELLGSRRMGEIIAFLKDQADLVLFDAPPIIAVTDAAVLASKVDGVLLVVNAGKTKRDLARRAKLLLDKVNANVLGVVLNNVKLEASLYRYYAGQG